MAKVADGIRYAERVVAGEIVAGEFVRLACQRFLDDLKYGEERGIYFSEPRAQHILNFYKFVPHVKGALAGQLIELMDWHVFILINIFGFVIPLVNEETGEVVMRSDGSGRPVMVRRFRTAYNEVARKNAKSTLSSGIGLYMTGADGEGGAEVYSAATTRDQARIVFEDAKNMVRKARSTLGRLFDFNKLAIYQEQSASKFEPLSSDANNLDGLNIHCAIIDELHAHKTRDVWDVLETATGARLQSLLQRFDPPLPCRWELLSIDAFARCFCFMTGPAQTLQVTVCIRATMSFRNDVVHSSGFNGSPIAQAVLTQMIITLQYARTYGIPFRAIATLVAAQSALMLYPSFATMFIAVTRTVCGCTCTSTLTAGAWDS